MKNIALISLLATTLILTAGADTHKGWHELSNLESWVDGSGKPVSAGSWVVVEGILQLTGKGGGDLYSAKEYGDFELIFDWKIAPKGNSGLKYRVRQYGGRMLGCEYQIYDDGKPDRIPGKGSTGSLYALFAPDPERELKPLDEFNASRIIVHGSRIEHWLNGRKIVSVTVGSPAWDEHVSASKFSQVPGFSRNRFGRIMLTDHGSEAWYRNFHITRP